jgi:transposase
MSIGSIISATLSFFRGLPKNKLVELIDQLRKSYQAIAEENASLREQIQALEAQTLKSKVESVNKQSNKPSSKQAEWEEKGVGNDGKGKKKRRGKKGRKGSGNQAKAKAVTREERAKVEQCGNCGEDLSQVAPLSSSKSRIIVDIPELPLEVAVIEVLQEKKYCSKCQKVSTASTDLALPKSDIGLNTTVHLIYLWISLCLPFTRISTYFSSIFGQKMSTSGLCAQVIRVAQIMQEVYDEILKDVKQAKILHADETGWRVQGKNWWLWVFGTHDSAIYTIDKSRGKDVVRRILGEFFMGVLVVDGWGAYLSLICDQQSCMAHLLRKIRKLYAAFPKLRSVFKFYIKFRRILRDGERLQTQRQQLGQQVFERRLTKLHLRLDDLLNWANPNDILKQIIKKINHQKPRILTFVQHPEVPCHNNYGEYLIRIGVLKRKVSFGSKSPQGAQAYATLLSLYTTCKLRKISFLDFMKQSLKHYTQTGHPLLLSQYMANKQTLNSTSAMDLAA